MTTPSISPINCANTYICPGVGNGYGIQFNITNADVSNLLQPSGLTIAARLYLNKHRPVEVYTGWTLAVLITFFTHYIYVQCI